MEERDLAAYLAGINDTDVGGPAGYRRPYTLEEIKDRLRRAYELMEGGQAYWFAVCELGDDRFIGHIWLKGIDHVASSAELSLFMDADHIGAGWGSDAQRALVSWGFGQLGLERIWLMASVENRRAIRSYEKVGFKHEGLLRRSQRGPRGLEDAVVMAILRDEWEPS